MMKLLRIIQVWLTVFYGHLLSVCIYENFINGICDLVIDPESVFNIMRVSVGGFTFITSLIGLVVVWQKSFKLIFITGLLLLSILMVNIIMATIKLSRNFETMVLIEKYKQIIDIIVKSICVIISIVLTFFMSSRRAYMLVPNNEYKH